MFRLLTFAALTFASTLPLTQAAAAAQSQGFISVTSAPADFCARFTPACKTTCSTLYSGKVPVKSVCEKAKKQGSFRARCMCGDVNASYQARQTLNGNTPKLVTTTQTWTVPVTLTTQSTTTTTIYGKPTYKPENNILYDGDRIRNGKRAPPKKSTKPVKTKVPVKTRSQSMKTSKTKAANPTGAVTTTVSTTVTATVQTVYSGTTTSTVSVPGPTITSPNLLVNPDFEATMNYEFAGWTYTESTPSAQIVPQGAISDKVYFGTRSAKIPAVAADRHLSQRGHLQVGATYRYGCFIRAANPGISITLWNGQIASDASTNGEWVPLADKVVYDGTAEFEPMFEFGSSATAPGEAYVDSCFVYRIA